MSDDTTTDTDTADTNAHARRTIATLELGDGFSIAATVPALAGDASSVALYFALLHEGAPRGWMTPQGAQALAAMVAAQNGVRS